MKIAMLQRNFTIGDIEGNAQKILDGYNEAVERGAELVVSSELALFGYPPKDMLVSVDYLAKQGTILKDWILNRIGHVGLVVGVADVNLYAGKPLFNSAVLIKDYKVVYTQHKVLLPTYDVFDEARYFESWSGRVFSFSHMGKRMAMLVCEDIWGGSEIQFGHHIYERDPIDELGEFPERGPEILIVINASPYYWGKGNVRFDIVGGIAKKLACTVVYVNQVGGNDELVFDGRSFAVSGDGVCIGAAKSFKEDLVIIDADYPVGWSYQFDDKVSELYDALVLGVRDYMNKCSFKGALIGLSGGIDSSLTACIAVDALGAENIMGVAMPSIYSSKESVEDARKLAENLGISFELIPIYEAYAAYANTLRHTIDWNEAGRLKEDVTEENIQARIRGNILMAISNRTGRMVLTTGNKSEIAVGYCTLYGDTAGGFAVLSDVPKSQVYELALFRNILAEKEVIPDKVRVKAPSAELRPNQRDSDSLPPYSVLDDILHKYIEEQKFPQEIVEKYGYNERIVKWVVDKIDKNEYKRRQMPLGLKVTSKAFGSGRRWPIAAKFL